MKLWPFKRPTADAIAAEAESLAERLTREHNAFRKRFAVGDRFEYLGRVLVCSKVGDFDEGFVGRYYCRPPYFIEVIRCDYADELGVLHAVRFSGEELATLEASRLPRQPVAR